MVAEEVEVGGSERLDCGKSELVMVGDGEGEACRGLRADMIDNVEPEFQFPPEPD